MSQLLTNYGAPNINGISAQRILSNQVLENIYQGIIEDDGKGVTQRFTEDCSGAQIRFIHVKPIFAKARELGATINGGNFPTLTHEGETDSFGLDVLTVLDDPIDLANVSKDMIPVDLLSSYVKSYTDLVNVNINAMTIGGKWIASEIAQANGSEVNITSYTEGGNLLTTFLTANSLLDDGAEDMGVAMFPQDDRCAVVQTAYRPILLANGLLTIGGANYAYDIAKKGSVDAGSEPRKSGDGFIGYIDSTPIHIASSLLFKVAGEYVGVETADIKNMIGYVSSGFANVRGIAAPRDVKVIDTPQGQGTRLQPLTRMGFKVVEGYEKGNSLIVKSGAKNIFADLKTLFGLADLTHFVSRGPASRITLAPVINAGVGTITITDAKASKIAFVATTNVVKGVNDFLTAYDAAAANAKGIATSGVAVASKAGLTANSKVYVLEMAADGTLKVSSATVA